jgi:8-oxo-dGTP pyrophosphatase MutT (NUDIX family)
MPKAAAVRELLEETGMKFGSLKLVELQSIGNNRLEWYVYRYVATDFIEQVAPQPGSGERIEVFELPLSEAQEKARDNVYAAPSVILSANSVEDIRALSEIRPLSE